MRKNIVIVAGGTGGHINAALAIGEYYEQKGYGVHYFSGKRYLDFQLYKDKKAIHLNVMGLRYKSIVKILKSFVVNLFALFKIFFQLVKLKPRVAIGTGGYVCGPVLLMARVLFIPTYILEQNAVLGLTNRLLGRFVKGIFLHFPKTKGINSQLIGKVTVVGNPVKLKYKANRANPISNNILVFGGSLGASQINQALEKSLGNITGTRTAIVHQVGKNNPHIQKLDTINYEAHAYLEDMEKWYAWADKIICRAGASSIAELRVVGKPCLLVPLPIATDDHQTLNAQNLAQELGSIVSLVRKDITVEDLSLVMTNFINSKPTYSSKPIPDQSLLKIDQVISEVL